MEELALTALNLQASLSMVEDRPRVGVKLLRWTSEHVLHEVTNVLRGDLTIEVRVKQAENEVHLVRELCGEERMQPEKVCWQVHAIEIYSIGEHCVESKRKRFVVVPKKLFEVI